MTDINMDAWTCPLPLRDHPNIVLGHGGGGKMSEELIKHLFLPHFSNTLLDSLGDSTAIDVNGQRLAVSTDTFTVNPLFFPGGNIGSLAVHGTVNDVAMSGAQPLYLTAAYVLEEGLDLGALAHIAESMAAACRQAGLQLIAGDTKVVEKGHGDGVFINTTGIGLIPAGVDIRPDRARPDDLIILSGSIGDHGMAILSQRQGLQFEADIISDSAPLNGLVKAMLEVTPEIHCLRDPTRGGLAATLNELAHASHVGMEIDERAVPIRPAVSAACEMLGLDPFYVANEGKLAAILPKAEAEKLLEAMRRHPYGREAAIIGRITAEHSGFVLARTGIGGSRIIDTLIGEQLPRIC